MRHLDKILPFIPRTVIAVYALMALVLALIAAKYGVQGEYTSAALMGVLALSPLTLAVWHVRIRWPYRKVIKLRNQLRRTFKRRLKGADQVYLQVDAGEMVLVQRFARIGQVSYIAVVAELDGTAAHDWNLALSQQPGLSRLRSFFFPPFLGYAEYEVNLAAGPEDLPDDIEHESYIGYVRGRAQHLSMDAVYATVPELQALLYLVCGGEPTERPGRTSA